MNYWSVQGELQGGRGCQVETISPKLTMKRQQYILRQNFEADCRDGYLCQYLLNINGA